MERDLKFHQNNAVNRGICPSAVEKWLNATSKSDLVKLSLTPHYIPAFVTAVYEGWGMSVDYIKKEFGWFTNGKKVMNCTNGDIEFKAICQCGQSEKTFDYDVDVVSVINSRNTTINVLNYSMQYHISNNSKIVLKSAENVALLNLYVYDDSIVNIKNLKGNVKVYLYSPNAKVIGREDVVIIKERNINNYL